MTGCGWLDADFVGETGDGNVYRSNLMASQIRALCHEATQQGEASELIVKSLEMAAYFEEMNRASRWCDSAIHAYVKKLERTPAEDALARLSDQAEEILEREG